MRDARPPITVTGRVEGARARLPPGRRGAGEPGPVTA
jgi:hypothetical protein